MNKFIGSVSETVLKLYNVKNDGTFWLFYLITSVYKQYGVAIFIVVGQIYEQSYEHK